MAYKPRRRGWSNLNLFRHQPARVKIGIVLTKTFLSVIGQIGLIGSRE
jgi:hypothetical protein